MVYLDGGETYPYVYKSFNISFCTNVKIYKSNSSLSIFKPVLESGTINVCFERGDQLKHTYEVVTFRIYSVDLNNVVIKTYGHVISTISDATINNNSTFFSIYNFPIPDTSSLYNENSINTAGNVAIMNGIVNVLNRIVDVSYIITCYACPPTNITMVAILDSIIKNGVFEAAIPTTLFVKDSSFVGIQNKDGIFQLWSNSLLVIVNSDFIGNKVDCISCTANDDLYTKEVIILQSSFVDNVFYYALIGNKLSVISLNGLKILLTKT